MKADTDNGSAPVVLTPRSKGGPVTPPGREKASLNSLRHGLYARTGSALQLRTRRVRRLVNRVFDALPWLTPADAPTVRSWAELEVIGSACFTILEAGGVTSGMKDRDPTPRRLLTDYVRLKGLQLRYEEALGMTPAARASLRVDSLKGDDLAAELSQARREQTEGNDGAG